MKILDLKIVTFFLFKSEDVYHRKSINLEIRTKKWVREYTVIKGSEGFFSFSSNKMVNESDKFIDFPPD